MTNDREHPAEGPEQEITSESPEFATQMAERTVEPGAKQKVAESGEAVDASSVTEGGPSDSDEEEASEVDVADDAVSMAKGQSGEREAPKLERLQKILAQAGVASRRHAEELITEGRVQVNGQTVTVLGSKADPERDHIRVDGKLLRGAERLRYFVLNKPRGFVTTVTDPEGRPTVMQFFAKSGERLYPVGRLDFQSEGLLLVTNDGELANKLTRAASGVEKTYVVKIAGQPDEGQLERLRRGVAIDKGRPLEGKVHTAPARIQQIRKGENPWFEVVLIEGRNRELRKMFEEIGHHVEKIRRVGYGPLVLDVEPGKIRELNAAEVDALRLTAEGKLKPRRPKAFYMLPKDAGKTTEERQQKARRFDKRRAKPAGAEPGIESTEPQAPKKAESRSGNRPKFGGAAGGRSGGRFDKGARSGTGRPFRPAGDGPKEARPVRPAAERSGEARPFRPAGEGGAKPFRPAGKPFGRDEKPSGPRREGFGERAPHGKDAGGDRPRTFERPRPERGEGFRDRTRPGSGSSFRPRDDRARGQAGPRSDRPSSRPGQDRSLLNRSSQNRLRPSGPRPDRPSQDRPREGRGLEISPMKGPGRERPDRSGGDRREFRGGPRSSGAGGSSSRREGSARPSGGAPKRSAGGSSFSGSAKRGPGAPSFSGGPKRGPGAGGSSFGGPAKRGPGGASFGGGKREGGGSRGGSGSRGPAKRSFGSKLGGAKRPPGGGGKRGPARPGGKRPSSGPGGKRNFGKRSK